MGADDQGHRFLCNYICMGVAHICTRHNNTTHFIEIIGGAQLVAGAALAVLMEAPKTYPHIITNEKATLFDVTTLLCPVESDYICLQSRFSQNRWYDVISSL